MRILVTGAAGFIGMHVTLGLLSQGYEVTGIDSLNDYYDPALKHARLRAIEAKNVKANFQFQQVNIADTKALARVFQSRCFDIVVHLAAQAGVRHSIDNPSAYLESNVAGFLNLLECMRGQLHHCEGKRHPIKHFLYASSSSVYGAGPDVPSIETMPADKPLSLYAATKRSNELMAHAYAHLFGIPSTGLRFFTVYGPWGRPDMAYFSFAKAILENKPITLFNQGNMKRDFTYIEDVVEAVLDLIDRPPALDFNDSRGKKDTNAPSRVINIGSSSPKPLTELVKTIENILGKKAIIKLDRVQAGDTLETYANIDNTKKIINFYPKRSLQDGLTEFLSWLQHYTEKAKSGN